MTPETRARLNAINRAFYETTASDFDATRQRGWPGWDGLRPHLPATLRVLDVGCGNGRFGRWLSEQTDAPVDYVGLDNNRPLLSAAQSTLAALPTVRALLVQQDAILHPLPVAAERWTLIVLFGVLHHVPGAAQRLQFIQRLAGCLAPGGVLVFTSWRFMEVARLRARLAPWPDDLPREPGDYLLDWRRGAHALRYCHYVDDAEQTALIGASGLRVRATYRADGFSGADNAYVVLTA